ncbi:MAG: transposase, partial [Nitrosomonas sp.]|nr:transposase [Nitrosomonas sp.]
GDNAITTSDPMSRSGEFHLSSSLWQNTINLYFKLDRKNEETTGIWNGGLSDESVEDMANSNLHVMRFLGLSLEDDVQDHSVLSRFRTRLTTADA